MSGLADFIATSILAIAAGVSIVVQQSMNSALRAALGSAAWAGFVSYATGTVAMLVLAAALQEGLPSAGLAARSPWWSWAGGVFGAIYIALAIVLLPRLGAATFIALLVGGQMLSSLVIDHFGWLGLAQHPISLPRLIGAMLLIAGVILLRS
jgi:bacterial/archaeal transporter family-2 protein